MCTAVATSLRSKPALAALHGYELALPSPCPGAKKPPVPYHSRSTSFHLLFPDTKPVLSGMIVVEYVCIPLRPKGHSHDLPMCLKHLLLPLSLLNINLSLIVIKYRTI